MAKSLIRSTVLVCALVLAGCGSAPPRAHVGDYSPSRLLPSGAGLGAIAYANDAGTWSPLSVGVSPGMYLQVGPTSVPQWGAFVGGDFLGTLPPLVANWTQVNASPLTWTDVTGGGITTNQGSVDTASTNRHLLVRAIPTSAPWTRTIRFTTGLPGSMGSSGGAPVSGLVLYESGTGKLIEFVMNLNGSGAFLSLIKLNSVSSFNAFYKNQNVYGGPSFESLLAMSVSDDGTNLTWSYRAVTTAGQLFVFSQQLRHDFLATGANFAGYDVQGGTGSDQTGFVNPTIVGWDGTGGTI